MLWPPQTQQARQSPDNRHASHIAVPAETTGGAASSAATSKRDASRRRVSLREILVCPRCVMFFLLRPGRRERLGAEMTPIPPIAAYLPTSIPPGKAPEISDSLAKISPVRRAEVHVSARFSMATARIRASRRLSRSATVPRKPLTPGILARKRRSWQKDCTRHRTSSHCRALRSKEQPCEKSCVCCRSFRSHPGRRRRRFGPDRTRHANRGDRPGERQRHCQRHRPGHGSGASPPRA